MFYSANDGLEFLAVVIIVIGMCGCYCDGDDCYDDCYDDCCNGEDDGS